MDLIERQAAIDELCDNCDHVEAVCPHYPCKQYIAIENLPSAQPEIIRCKDCEYGEQDEIGRWYCRGLGCQMGDDDGSGFCSDAERRKK